MSTEVAAEEVTLAQAISAAITDRLIDLHVSMPAKVESYDASKQTVDVIPQLNRALPIDPSDPATQWVTEALPKLSDVPVCFPRAGGFFVSFPIAAGDYVLLVFSERNLGAWRATATQGDPGDLGMHTLDGAVAIPGVFPDANALSNASGTNMVLGSDSTGDARIEITPTGIKLGAGATDPVARANEVESHLTAITQLLSTCVPGVAETGLAGVKTAAITLVSAGFTDVASTNTMVK